MQTKQYLQTVHNSLKVSSVARLLAVGAIASGAAVFSTAPASAVILNGGLNFSDGTNNFFTSTSQNSYNVTFNPTLLAQINDVSDNFTPFFGGPLANLTSSSSGTFNLVSGNVFSLASALNFDFSSGVRISIDAGSTFTRNFNDSIAGVGFSNLSVTGQAINGADSVNLPSLSFVFGDPAGNTTGNYGIGLQTTNPLAVPEPFTIIGTLVGGTAALRMRKKLSDAAKH